MRVWMCVLALLVASNALATEMFVYTNPVTKRDVYVNNLEQVPVEYRDRARPVRTDHTAAEPVVDPSLEPFPTKVVAKGEVEMSVEDVKVTATGTLANPGSWREFGRVFAGTLDQKLKASGRPGLFPSEVIALSRLFVLVVVLMVVAWVASLTAWIVFLFHAFRSSRVGWMVGMILFFPLSYLYALLCVEKGRWMLRYGGFLAVAAPALVGLFAAWRAVAWFRAVMEVRGGMG